MNIRRTFAVGALAATVCAAPTAAFAATYPAPEDSLTCSATQVSPSETYTCQIAGPEGAEAQLQATTAGEDASIAGTVTSEAKAITDGSASYTVTAPSVEGTVGHTAIIDGVAVDTASVVVAEELSATGFESMGLAIGAGALLVAGAGAVVVGARRRANQDA